MVVWGDGKVGSCELLEPIGDIREQTWSEVLCSAELSNQIQFIEDKKCHCTHNCAMLDSIFFNPGSIPKLLTSVEI